MKTAEPARTPPFFLARSLTGAVGQSFDTEAFPDASALAFAFAFTGDSKLRGCVWGCVVLVAPEPSGFVGFSTVASPTSEPCALPFAFTCFFGGVLEGVVEEGCDCGRLG